MPAIRTTRARVSLVERLDEELVVPATVLAEVAWVLKLLGHDALGIFVENLAGGAYRLEPIGPADLRRAAGLERTCPDRDPRLVDASVIVLCERLDEPKVATLDRRDFSVVRPRHREALELLPE